MIFNKITIISGGQSGVDRAALDFALKNGLNCGGWCPKNRIAEDGRISEIYPLKETSTTDYSQRTRKNVHDSHGTLIINFGRNDNGTSLTVDICKELSKPVFDINLKDKSYQPGHLIKWLNNNNIRTLNIAGPRESSSPGIYKSTLHFLEQLS